MDFSFTSSQDMLRDTLRRFLEDRCPVDRVREVMAADAGYDAELWDEVTQLGFAAMHIPEELGGAGSGYLELGIVMEELGRVLAPLPLLSSIVLGANLLMDAGTGDQKKEILPAVAAGERRLAVALVDENGSWDNAGSFTQAVVDGGDVVLTGTKSFVVDGHTADTLVVAASTDSVVDFYLVDAGEPGLSRRRLDTMDPTRRQASVVLDGVRVPQSSRLGAAGSGGSSLTRLYGLAAVALAFEQVGGAHRCLEMAVDYAKERTQFGRAIGSFQAVKHKCAEMLVQVESAKAIAYYAGWAATSGGAELAEAAPLAKSYCSDAYYFCAAGNIQVHGGIGFTWEHDAHLYFKRAKTSQLMFGDSTRWRAVLANRLGI